ncbi:OSJNBa0042D13.18 protein, related [Eimeria praecox]|uniref:OSJNBa0042D13.18 protein, related n=1 Tax=Eimeria praecox TaxID=51316 RepID=U6GVD6_9EIME|nr:OSJNBa0042D13.18 protein, related [Eimeria praecox]
MTPDPLNSHKQGIAKLSANGWIGPTSSPICALTIMVDKRDGGTLERKMHMVVNYQALNALTIASEFPFAYIKTILEMLRGAKYFSTPDVETGFHQIRTAKEDRWKTGARTVMRLCEYRVMPFGLKGAPATFQDNINAYQQPLLGQGVTKYLDDVLIYSRDLPRHATLLRQVLSIFFKHQFCPKLDKCKNAKRELTYLGYTVGAKYIKLAADKVKAIRAWPEVLANETKVRQFLGAVNYCRMFMGPDYAEVARPLVDLTRKGATFRWTDAHTQAVRQLRQAATLQVPDTSKPSDLCTDASGYAIGGVLEQDGQRTGFLSQVMNPIQQKYSISDQELLAFLTALDKLSYLIRAAQVTLFTDLQALTHLQQLKVSTPLRRRASRWLDFLAGFPHLEETRNQVVDALSRHPSYPTPQHLSTGSDPAPLPYEPTTPLLFATAPAEQGHTSTGKRTNYRAWVGLQPRTPRGRPASHSSQRSKTAAEQAMFDSAQTPPAPADSPRTLES